MKSNHSKGIALTQEEISGFGTTIRTAFSNIAWNTGSSSPGDELMTLRTSAVAVCCWSDLRSSLSSRVFSIAMTA